MNVPACSSGESDLLLFSSVYCIQFGNFSDWRKWASFTVIAGTVVTSNAAGVGGAAIVGHGKVCVFLFRVSVRSIQVEDRSLSPLRESKKKETQQTSNFPLLTDIPLTV